MKNFVQPGDMVDFTAPTGGVVAGKAVKIGSLIVIPATDAAEGATFSGAVTGVFDVDAATSQAWTEGAAIYWDDTNKVFTTTATSNTKAGHAVAVKGSADVTGRVRLQPAI